MHVRTFEGADATACALVFYRAVHEGTVAHYTPEQRAAWVPAVPETATFEEFLGGMFTYVAERDGDVVGFLSLTEAGHVNMAYVLPSEMGQGTAGAMYRRVLEKAADLGLQTLTTEASHLARPFFVRQGWTVVKEQLITRNGVTLGNTVMSFSPKTSARD